jgi:very-short-patch-repair endonuclease
VKNVDPEAIHDLHGNVRYFKELRDVARNNRNNPTVAEKVIWEHILKNKKTGYLFLRQKPLFRFIADFYCSELALVIEIDGGSHNNKKGFDESRDKFFKQIGIKTIRFTNDQVLNQLKQVENILKVSLVKGRNGEAERDWN